MTELQQGDTFVSDSGETHYQIQDVKRTFDVVTKPADGSDDPDDVETITYPESTLRRKLDRGELERVDGGSDDDNGEIECPAAGCDDTFDTEQGAKSHFSQVHDNAADSANGE